MRRLALPGHDLPEYGLALGLPWKQVAAAEDVLHSGDAVFLSVNGKLASGKDTVAPLALEAVGVVDALHLYFALALKDEVDVVFDEIRLSGVPYLAAVGAMDRLGVPHAHRAAVRSVVEAVWDEVRGDRALTSRHRTDGIRRALQLWGTEVRRAQDPEYWVKATLRPAVTAMAEGRSVYFTDCRFENEVRGASRCGFVTVRLEVTPDVQRQRLMGRDGLKVNEEALLHPSETALDGYPGFDLVTGNDGPVGGAAGRVARVLADRFGRPLR